LDFLVAFWQNIQSPSYIKRIYSTLSSESSWRMAKMVSTVGEILAAPTSVGAFNGGMRWMSSKLDPALHLFRLASLIMFGNIIQTRMVRRPTPDSKAQRNVRNTSLRKGSEFMASSCVLETSGMLKEEYETIISVSCEQLSRRRSMR